MNSQQQKDQFDICKNALRGIDSVCTAHNLSNTERFSVAGAYMYDQVRNASPEDRLRMRLIILGLLPNIILGE